MGRQHRSSRLLNKAISNGGKLTVFTELSHTFLPGDLVYISGGYYDNCSDNLYESNWITSGAIFTNSQNKAYKVLLVNVGSNSITLDVNVSSTPFFPYCSKTVNTNIYGDPTDAVDPAYVTEVGAGGDNLYNHVYISQVYNANTRIQKGTINNGIFGHDDVFNYVGQKLGDGGNSSYKNNLTITHICAKRVKMDYGIINSKSSNSEITQKFDINIYSPSYNLNPVSVGPNNDYQGYSYFQCIWLGSIYSAPYLDIEVTTSKLGNGGGWYNNGAYLTKVLVNGAWVGTMDVAKNNSTVLEDCKVINGSFINNAKLHTNTGSNIIEDTNYNNYISLYLKTYASNSIVYDGAGTITFSNFDAGSLIGKKLEYSPTHVFYITGIKDGLDNTNIEYLNGECRINSFSYTYGTLNSGSMSITFNDLASNSADFIAKYTTGPGPSVGTYYVDFLYLRDLLLIQGGIANDQAVTNVKIPYIYSLNKTTNFIGAIVNDASTPTGRPKLITNRNYNINIFGGYVKNTDIANTVLFLGTYTKVISDLYQLVPDNTNNTPFETCIFKPDTTTGLIKRTYSGIFTDCVIHNGNFTNSDFYNTYIISKGSTSLVFLFNSRILTTSYVDNNVKWDYINFDPTRVTYSLVGGYYVKDRHGYFQGRTTPFVIGSDEQITNNHGPLTSTDYVWNLNNSKTRNLPFYAASAYAPYTGNEVYDTVPFVITNNVLDPNHNIKIATTGKIIPNVKQIQASTVNIHPSTYAANATVAMFNLGTLKYVPGGNPSKYISNNNYNYLMTAENFTTNTALNNVLFDIESNYLQPGINGSGAVDASLTLSGPFPYTVRSNSVFSKNDFHYYNSQVVDRTDTMIWVDKLTTPHVALNFSQYLQTTFRGVGGNTLTNYSLILNGTTIINETVNAEGVYGIQFTQMNWWDAISGTISDTITGGYIEIESVIVEKYDAINGNILTYPDIIDYSNDPLTCGPITEQAYHDNRNFMYDSEVPYSTNIPVQSLEPYVTALTAVPGEFWKVSVNLAVYMYNSRRYTDNCGKYEMHNYYFWIQFT